MRYNEKNLTNKKFGKLTALEKTDKRQDGGSIVWKCKCDCGNIIEISSKRLQAGINVSCGCYQKERQKYSMNKLHDGQFIDNTNIDLISRQKANSNSKSGVRGVHWCKSKRKWIATLNFQKKLVLNKSFDDLNKAIQARKEAEEKYFNPILEKYEKQNIKISKKKEKNDNFNRSDKRPFVDRTNLNYIKPHSNQRTNNKSGHKGVCWDNYAKQYKAYIQIKNKFINLGFSKNIEEAIRARKEAEEKYFNPILSEYSEQIIPSQIFYKGESHTLKEWSKILNIPYSTIVYRYNKHSDDLDFVFSTRNHVKQIIVEYNGEKHTLWEWSKILNINYSTLLQRYKKNINNLDCIFTKYNKKS